MAVNSRHPDYINNEKKWQIMRDVFNANLAKETYIPRLGGQDNEDYQAYVTRAEFYNATGRTKDALNGLLFAKKGETNLPSAFNNIIENISLDDDSLEDLSRNITDECLAVGRCGVLVDLPNEDKIKYTKAEAERLNIRAYATLYKAENIINWKVTKINGSNKTSFVVLQETYTEQTEDEFIDDIKTRYRVLDLQNGAYRQRVFIEGKNSKFELISEIYPTANGKSLNYIPFTFFNVRDLKAHIDKPPLYDLAKINISHFKSEVDLEHGAHFTALPTPYVLGWQSEENEVLKIGSSVVWSLRDKDAKVGFLEFSGAGLGALEKRIEIKEKRMAILGARLLLDEKKTAEATETVVMRSAGERAVLTTIADTVSAGIVSFLTDIAKFENIEAKDIVYEINKDYNLATVNPQLLSQIMLGVQSGQIPNEVLYDVLYKGELMPETISSYEDYQLKLDYQEPSLEVNK